MNKSKVTRKKAKGIRILAALLFAFFLLPFYFAEGAAPPERKAQPSDQADYVFFASDRPVLIRMHLRMGDKPYSVGWDAWMGKLFTWYDKDGDGFLSPTEWARVPDSQFLTFQIQGSIGNRGNPTPFVNVDTNKDGKVSKEEFRAYFRNGGMTPLRFFNNNYQATTAKSVNDAIYKRVEVATTGKLTQEKLARLQTLVRNLDENEDELLSAQELQLESGNTGIAYATPVRGRGMPVANQAEPGLLEIRADAPAAAMPALVAPPAVGVKLARRAPAMMGPQGSNLTALAQQMLAFYDKGKKGKLSPKEIAFDPKLFAQLDANHDGFLDVGELVGFFKREPDLVFRANVGQLTRGSLVNTITGFLGMKGAAMPNRAEILNTRTQPLAKKVKRVNGDNLTFVLGDSRFELQANEGQSGRFNNGTKQFYLQQYDSLAEKKGYVDRAQEKDNAMNPFLFYLFPHADRNADGKLTRKELEAYLDMVSEGSTCFVSVQVEDSGRSLFNIIDSNGDGQLSIREMRTAWERVKPLCKDGKGLEQKDLPRSLRIAIGQGNTYFQGRAVPLGGGMAGPSRPARGGNVPAWFTKMDLNNDGDVSPKEWLGTEEEFRMIDTDGDGLISADEARQYEARRKKEEKKPASTKLEPKNPVAPK